MQNILEDLKEQYFSWLRDNYQSEQISNNIQRISTPFLDRNNDFTEIYIVKQNDGTYKITDDSYIINELEFSGFKFSPKRRETLNRILLSFNASINENNEIFTIATESDIVIKKHMLINCLIKVSDLFNLKEDTVKSLFLEDVQMLLDKHNVRYIENFTLSGRSHLSYQFDFAIPKTPNAPQRIIRAINNIDITQAKLLIFTWEDTKLTRQPNSTFIPIINNINKPISDKVLTCLKEYSIYPIQWSNIENDIDKLTA